MINLPEESIPAPKMEKLVFQAKLSGTLENLQETVKSLPAYEIDLEGGVLTLARVESRNIHKIPYLFHLIELKSEEVSVSYSIPSNTGEILRRASILRDFSSLMSLISEHYAVDQGKLMQYIASTLDTTIKGLSQPYSTLFNQYNTMVVDYRAVKRLNVELSASNRNLIVQTSQLSEENKKMSEELNKLKKHSDESLMVMVQDWIDVHNNSIDISQFAKTYDISVPRAEEILDKMVSLGYLEMKG